MKRIIVVSIFLTLLLASAIPPTPTQADGIIIPEPPVCIDCPILPPPPREIPYLTVQNHRVNVTILNQVATTRVDQIFRNDSQWSLEGTYIFPMPENAAISDFAMWIDGERIDGQLYTKEEARRIYDNIVRRRLDPALLEYVGRDLFQASIFPIDPGDTRRVQIEYSQILPIDNGLVQYVYPLSTERFSGKPLEDVSVTVQIESTEAIKAIYSASHPVSINRDGRFQASAGWEDSNVKPSTDFNLYYTVSAEDVGVSLLSFKERGEDGFFVLLAAPNVDAEQVLEKDVIMVLDTSGSMEGQKMEQAGDAINFVLDHLNEGDRFNIIAFSTGVRSFATRPEPLSALSEARRFVDNLRPEGSTDINYALLEAVNNADSSRPTIIIFLTDGLPTSGVVDTPLILNNIEQAAASNVRLFPFGVGDDVDTILLDSLAQQQRGATAYVRPGQRVDEHVSSFYAKVSSPVLADISLDVSGVRIEGSYPNPLPDLFAGSQLILTGRYREGGAATISLTGDVNGRNRTFRFNDLTFATGRQRNQNTDFIPRLWATRKVGYLLNQVRLHGENREMVDEIVNLSIRYGIITPYTSFLVEEPEMALSREGRDTIAKDEFARGSDGEVSGGAAVDKAVGQNSLADAPIAAPMPSPSNASGSSTANVTAVGDKAFVLKDGIWTDTTFDSTGMTTTPLPFPSELFIQFLTEHPDTGKYFALGSQVIVIIDGTAYQTVEGEVDNIPTPIDVEKVQSAPSSTPISSATPASSTEIYTTLTVDVVEGVAPLELNLTGELVGGEDNNPDYYCVETGFDFGDGISQMSIPSCLEWQESRKIQRTYTANYVYEEPGEYQVSFTLGDTTSDVVTVVVTGEDTAKKITTTPQPTPTNPDENKPSNDNKGGDNKTDSSSWRWLLLLVTLLVGIGIGIFLGRNKR